MSGSFIGYPTGWILGVIDDPNDAAGANAELASAGIGADDRMILSGAAGAQRFDGLGAQSGFRARLHRIMRR